MSKSQSRQKIENTFKKMPVWLWVVTILGLCCTIVAYVFADKLFGANSVFNKSVSDNDVLNNMYHAIPKIIKTVQVISIALVVNLVLKLIMRKVFTKSNRGITVVKLLESCIKWIIAIVAVLAVLKAWGVDTSTLLASAGILTLVIGLGAQSLVADIVAGIFIVFEGEYQVGDIVIINGWRGKVMEIGIRTTKIVDAGGNINIVNNSQISTIVNQTQDVSVAKCVMSIEYGESIPRVESIVKDNFGRIKQNVAGIIDGPFYKGVNSLSSSSVDLLFTATCREDDIYQVQRDLNRELKLIFDENGVNIPFPQIVVNKPSAPHTPASDQELQSAKEFVEEQKILSKGIDVKED